MTLAVSKYVTWLLFIQYGLAVERALHSCDEPPSRLYICVNPDCLTLPALCMRIRPLIIMVQSPPQAAQHLLQWQQTCSCGWEDAGGSRRNGLALAQPHSEWQPFRVVCAEASSAVLPTLPLLFVFLCRHSLLLLPCPGSNMHYSLTSFQSLWLFSTLALLALRIRALISLTGLDKRTGSSAPFFIWPWS